MMLCRFPYGGTERTELIDWCAAGALWASKQKDIDGGLLFYSINDTPTSMCRNLAVKAAIFNNVDILVMVDNDMQPDEDRSKPFLPLAFDFIKSRWHTAPTIISAPYLTAGPSYNPVHGTWRTHKDGFGIKAEVLTREEAANFTGIQPCSLHGTGLMAVDTRIFSGFPVGDEIVKLPHPYFAYEYEDESESVKSSTEDMFFSRNATLLFAEHNIEIGYCAWDCWAYHVKTQKIGKPHTVSIRTIAPIHRRG
jgi:hypothetical protein